MREQENFNIKSKDNIEYIQINDSYSFFDGVVSFLAGVCSTSMLIDAYNSKTGRPYDAGDYLYFEGRKSATNKIYYFFPYEIYKFLVKNKWPNTIKIHYKSKPFENQEKIKGAINGFKKVFLSLGQAMYIQYWELANEKISELFGNDQKGWDNIFQFGWIVRNALAHNFKININNSKIDNVTWNELNFGYSTNGTDISEQLMFLELVILMKEIEDELEKYSR